MQTNLICLKKAWVNFHSHIAVTTLQHSTCHYQSLTKLRECWFNWKNGNLFTTFTTSWATLKSRPAHKNKTSKRPLFSYGSVSVTDKHEKKGGKQTNSCWYAAHRVDRCHNRWVVKKKVVSVAGQPVAHAEG